MYDWHFSNVRSSTNAYRWDRGMRVVGHTTKRLLPGKSHFDDKNLERDGAQLVSSSLDKYSHKHMQDQRKVSIESSRPSYSSSSRSSSFSSLDYNRATPLEPGSFERVILTETSLKEPSMTLQNSSPQFSQKTVDLRDLVKDSIYREGQGLSAVPVDKCRELPKPQSKFNDGVPALNKRKSTPSDIKESLGILAKLQDAPCYHNGQRELRRSSSYHSKSGSSFSIFKDAPRFSYDEKQMNCTNFDPRDGAKKNLKHNDLPRHSLDSRESSMRSLGIDSKSYLLSKSMQEESGGGGVDHKVKSQQAPGNQARPPSVVAKLMGLEMLPDSVSSSDTNVGSSRSYLDENFVNISSTYEESDPRNLIQQSNSSKNFLKELNSQRLRSSDTSVKPISRLPIEPAPWKHIDGTRSSQNAASRSTRAPAKAPTMFPSVYSEIENRLKDLEFTQSGKDLRALKQIMEAMQAKGHLETAKEGEGSNFASYKDHELNISQSSRSVDNQKSRTDQVLVFTETKTLSAQHYESPVVLMKPAKLVYKSGIPSASIISLEDLSVQSNGTESFDSRKGLNGGRTSKDLISKSSRRDNAVNSASMKKDRTLKTTQTTLKSQQLAKEGASLLRKTSRSITPKMQQKKLQPEKRIRPPTPPDSSKSRRQSDKQLVESNSPVGIRILKYSNSHQNDDQLSEVSVESRNLSSLENEFSTQSNETILQGSINVKKSTLLLSEEEAAEFGYVLPEYSSPVSVLDSAVYKHDSPSPIKYARKILEAEISTVDERNLCSVEQSSPESFGFSSVESGAATFDFNRKKLQNIENLVQKLRRLNSTHDETRIDYIASLCEKTNPDHRYVSEILLASGLLLRNIGSSLTDFQFHPSGYPLNPELFLVLEQTKACTSSKEDCRIKITTQSTIEKFHRKLIFDAVNEILARKLEYVGSHTLPWCWPLKLARKALNAQNLLKELCFEIDSLQTDSPKCRSDEDDDDDGWKKILCNDVTHRSESWLDMDVEISGAVLDIESLIFKDLVDEIVRGEYAGLINKPNRRKNCVK